MIKDLTEAISHAREKAEELKKDADYLDAPYGMDTSARTECLECAAEHEQLVEWLTELQERRETMELIKKHYVLVEKSPKDNPNELIIRKAFGESEATE